MSDIAKLDLDRLTDELLSTLTKAEMLDVLQRVPQHFWPPRPTRQDKATIRAAIRAARDRK